jgi:hypothetical protein
MLNRQTLLDAFYLAFLHSTINQNVHNEIQLDPPLLFKQKQIENRAEKPRKHRRDAR